MINTLYALAVMTFLLKYQVTHIFGKQKCLCNCGIEADNHYLLESLAASDLKNSKLTMYFTINLAFANYLDMFPNLTESLQVPLIKNKTTYEQIIPLNLSVSSFDKTLLHASTNLNDFLNNYIKRKDILIIKKGMKPQY